MKKSYVYFIAPLVGLGLFAGVYWKYASTYDAKLEAAAAAQRKIKEGKIHDENLLKKKAVEDAIAAQERRKQEKTVKEAKEQEDRDRRDRAVQARNKAREDSRRFADQVKRFDKEIEENKREMAKIEEEKKSSVKELAFLEEIVPKAEANRKALATVLEKIAVAEKAAEEEARRLAREAAAAAKK